MLAAAVLAVAVSLSLPLVSAKYTCSTELGTYYPYCVNVPDGASDGDKLPVILMLSGSGARNTGDSSKVKGLSGYDGFGKVINQYLSGNKGADQVMAAEKFITVIPISPQYAQGGGEVRHWWPEYLDQVLDDVKSKYPADSNQIHCSGYSMGARGCWRYATARPNVLASTSSSAGAAEQAGDGTLSQQKADPTFPLLKNIVNLPVWQFAGSSDTTAGTVSPKATEAQLVKLGSSVASLTIENTDHPGMGTMPFNSALMTWMLKQKRNGGTTSTSSASTTKSSDVVSASNVPVRNGAGTGATKGRCTKRRAKRSAGASPPTAHKQLRRGLTLEAILASTGRGKVASNNPTTVHSANVAITKRDAEGKRGLSLAAILDSRTSTSAELDSTKTKKATIVESPLDRRAASVKALPVGAEKMARRMR